MNEDMKVIDVVDALPRFYLPYSAYVLQTRALPDARDGLKTGARFILYAQYSKGITHNNKFRKGTATIAETMLFSPHGDQSIYGNVIRMAQPFSLRYPVIEAQGNVGTQVYGDDYAAQRYVELRGGEIANEMLSMLEKDTISKWKWNYSHEQQYPSVLPTKFPFSLVNGSFGIGISCSSSIPQFNIVDVSNALVKMIDNSGVSFEDIYCPIDFATGGIIVNEEEVKESLKNGHGRAAIIRSKIIYDEKENELVVTEMPYQVFTSSVMTQIQSKIDDGTLKGVESAFDGNGKDGLRIFIKLIKGADYNRVIKSLYDHTSLQSSYSINMMMLKDGKVPKIFSWEEAMRTYLAHLQDVIRKGLEYDLKKIRDRKEILEGFVRAIPNIDLIIKAIKESDDSKEAKKTLIDKFDFTDRQATAILALKLSSLSKLEKYKIDKELSDLLKEEERISLILSDEEKFKDLTKEEVIRVRDKYGDARRTENISLSVLRDEEKDEETIVEKQRMDIYVTNYANIFCEKSSTLAAKKKKLFKEKNEFSLYEFCKEPEESAFVVTNDGLCKRIMTTEEPQFAEGKIVGAFSITEKDTVVCITEKGRIKRISAIEFYASSKKKIVKLSDDDCLVSAYKEKTRSVGILTSRGNFCIIDTEREKKMGSTAQGNRALKLENNDIVVRAEEVTNNGRALMRIKPKSGQDRFGNFRDYYLIERGGKGVYLGGDVESVSFEEKNPSNFDLS